MIDAIKWLAILGVAILAYVIYRRVTGDAGALLSRVPSPAQVADDAASLVNSLPSFIDSKLFSESVARYITPEQQRAQAAARLALKRAGG